MGHTIVENIKNIYDQSKQYKNVKELKFIFMASTFNIKADYHINECGKKISQDEKAKDVYITDEEQKKYSQVRVEKVPPPTFRY